MRDLHPAFEAAALAVVDGDLASLGSLLEQHPELARARGPAPFGATLLHYVAANGVEDELQRSPANAVEVCRLLLAAGAAADATSQGYGGGPDQTPLCLLVSSGHPHERGVQVELVHALVSGGARVDGALGDGAPLATSLVFGYTRSAEALAALGARTDNLLFAAGLGDRQAVDAWFDESGQVQPGALGSYRPPVPLPAGAGRTGVVQEALHLAVTHGRLEVASDLLERGADVDGRVHGHHCELPLLQALFVGALDAARLLLERGADPDLHDGKRGVRPRQAMDAARLSHLLEGLAD